LALVLSTLIGLPLAQRILPNWAVAAAIAPIVGWAVLSVLALITLSWTGFTTANLWRFAGAAALVAAMTLRWSWIKARSGDRSAAEIPIWSYVAAGLLAIVPALGVWPKFAEGGIVLAAPMFDHSKIAIIDDIIRLGLPPGNPVFGEVGTPSNLAYYYLWHFTAAAFGKATGATGWEADIGLTWFTAFASLALMMGIAVWLSGRSLAAPLVVMLGFVGSLRPILVFLLTPAFLNRAFSQDEPPHAWLYQASWVPQHLASACCVVLAIFILYRIAVSRDWLLVPLLAAIVAAGFESSTWVGGVVFAASAIAFGLVELLTADNARSATDFFAKAIAAAILALIIVAPFLRAETVAMATRGGAVPIAFHPFEVIGAILPASIRHVVDLPAYWLVLLIIEFPAISVAGAAAMIGALAGQNVFRIERRLVVGFTLLSGVSFGIAWLFISTIANNDLGWRGVLPGVLTLTILAAAGLSRWFETRLKAATAIACILLGLPGGLQVARENIVGIPASSAPLLAESRELWAAVRHYAAPDERVGNNPLYLSESVYWPVNISWALFANRRSCYAGWELARAFVALPTPEIQRLEAFFERVFAGDATAGDIEELARRYDCRVVAVVAGDRAWTHDPFAESPFYRLVDQEEGKWRIYRAVATNGK
jgi:hypothetical protein